MKKSKIQSTDLKTSVHVKRGAGFRQYLLALLITGGVMAGSSLAFGQMTEHTSTTSPGLVFNSTGWDNWTIRNNGGQGLRFYTDSAHAAGTMNFYIHKDYVWSPVFLRATNGMSVNSNSEDGRNNGIRFWRSDVSSWAMYMTHSSKQRADGSTTGTAPLGIGGHTLRQRVYKSSNNGFVWENHNNEDLMVLNAGTGELYTKGKITIQETLGTDSKTIFGRSGYIGVDRISRVTTFY